MLAGNQIVQINDFKNQTTKKRILSMLGLAGGTNNAFVDVTGTSQTLSPGTVYYANNASLVTFTLPVTFNQNDIFTIIGKGTGLWKIAQNAGQTIHGATNTTTGTGGSLASQTRYDVVVLRGSIASTDLTVTNKQGTLTSV